MQSNRTEHPCRRHRDGRCVATLVLALAISCCALTRPAFSQDKPGTQRVGVAKLTPKVKASITRGLAYLAKPGIQHEDGSWGSSSTPVAETSLSLMAFMLKGYVPGRGSYGRKMDNGIVYLINRGKAQRGFLGSPKNHAGMYEHGLAILALSEAWGQSKNPHLRSTLRKAVDITLRSQNKEGGWRYTPKPLDADLSMTVMQLVALNSAKESGIAVPDKTMQQATKYVLSCQDQTSGGFKYTAGGSGPGFARTAAGVMSLIMCGQRGHKATLRGLAFLKHYPDATKFSKNCSRFHYSHYYAIQAMYQSGGANFQAWYPKVASTILSMQKADGSWTGGHGTVYSTSLSILILGVPYRYLPIYQR